MDSDEQWTVTVAVRQLFPANKNLSDTRQKSKSNLRRRIRYAIDKEKLPLLDDKEHFLRSACLRWADDNGLNIPEELRRFVPSIGWIHLEVPMPVLKATGYQHDDPGRFATRQDLEQAYLSVYGEHQKALLKIAELESENAALQAENEALKSELRPYHEAHIKGGQNAAAKRHERLRELETQFRDKGYPRQQARKLAAIQLKTSPLKKD